MYVCTCSRSHTEQTITSPGVQCDSRPRTYLRGAVARGPHDLTALLGGLGHAGHVGEVGVVLATVGGLSDGVKVCDLNLTLVGKGTLALDHVRAITQLADEDVARWEGGMNTLAAE